MNWKKVGDAVVSIVCGLAGTAMRQGSDAVLRSDKGYEEKNKALKAQAMGKDLKKVKNMDDYKNLDKEWRREYRWHNQ